MSEAAYNEYISRDINNDTKKTIQSNEEITEDRTWKSINDQYNADRNELEKYLRKKNVMENRITLEHHPIIMYLNDVIFPILCQGLIEVLEKVRKETSCYRQKSAFNGLDFLSEYLFNLNPRYPERKENWTYIFDMEWVQNHLVETSRPFYPFSLIWTREYAALKIQSYMRGYWVRRQDNVQEVRNFWKDYKLSKKTEAL